MTVSRIDWTTALVPGARITPVVLVAGVPVVLTASGVRPLSVALTAGTADPLWWPGSGTLIQTLPGLTLYPVEDLLDPRETWEVYETASLLEGNVEVEALTFSMLDPSGRATAMVSIREARVAQELAEDLSAAATTVRVGSLVGLPTEGVAAVGRETITYTGTSTAPDELTGVVRGRFGSAARLHTAPTSHPPLVTAGGPRHWQGRLATVWLCALSADGLTLSDPTLIYAGTVGVGVQLQRDLTRWSVPLIHITKSLARKIETRPVNLYGWQHYSISGHGHPLILYDNLVTQIAVGWNPSDANDNGGFHADVHEFVRAADAVARAATSSNVAVGLAASGRMTVTVSGSDLTPTITDVFACWDPNNAWGRHVTNDDNSPATWTSTGPAPEACYSLDGWVKIPRAEDFGTIPTTFVFASSLAGLSGEARIGLTCDTDMARDVVCGIVERDASGQRLRLSPLGYPTHINDGGRFAYPLLSTRRRAARLGIVARGPTPVVALLAAALAIDALTGQDLYESCVDWEDLHRAFLDAPAGSLPQARVYEFHGDDSFLDVLTRELRLRGMAMAMVHGRITGVRLQNFANAESTVITIGEHDTLMEGGRELPPEVIDNDEPLATRMKFALPGDTSVEIEDSTYASEFGTGKALECDALLSLGGALPDLVSSTATLYDVAQQVLGALAEPNRTVRIPLAPTHMGLQPGQRVELTHSRIPNWIGLRGFSSAVCQVRDVRRALYGGRLRITAGLRVQSGTAICGYAPEAMVAPGGISAGSAVVTVDTSGNFGQTCFASKYDAAGNGSTNAVDGFEVGDAVVLSEYARTPLADEPFTVVAVDPVANTITLSGNPTAPMAASAAARYRVTLRFAPYGSCTTRQRLLFAWIADQTTQTLNSTDSPKRWGA